jgi:hypothetical protein
MNSIKRSIFGLVAITCLLVVGCEEDGLQQTPPETSPSPEESFVIPSGIGSPSQRCGSGGQVEGCENGGEYNPNTGRYEGGQNETPLDPTGQPKSGYDSGSSTNQLFQ